MNTPEDVIKIAKISQCLSQNEIENKGLYGGGTDLLLPRKIYNIRKSVEWANSYTQPVEVNATSTITITNNNNTTINSTLIYVDDPILGVIMIGESQTIEPAESLNDINYKIWSAINNSSNNYGYNAGAEPLDINTFTVTAPSGRGDLINGVVMYFTFIAEPPSYFTYTITPFSGGVNEIDLGVTSTSNYLNALCGKYALEANYLISPGGIVSNITTPAIVPTPIEFVVSGSSLIPNGGNSAVVGSFIGFNLLFIRNGISQSTINNGSSYFSWDKGTGTFVCYGNAVSDELFQLYPFI